MAIQEARMTKYFVAGNIWLLTSVALLLGQTVARAIAP